MTRSTITPAEAAEIKRHWAEYDDATVKAAAALAIYSTNRSAPATFTTEDRRAGEAIKRIRQILGD